MTDFKVREFGTGAIRDLEDGKFDYEGFLSPLVLERYAEYMHKHRTTAAGVRASDNWQKGMTRESYIKSCWRHLMEWWKVHRHLASQEGIEDAMCGVMFNVMGYMHEYLKAKRANAEMLDGGARLPMPSDQDRGTEPLRPVRPPLRSDR